MPSDSSAIHVNGLSKLYRKGVSGSTRLTEWRSTTTSRKSDFWALKDVSFDVEQGHVLGIVGRNGAGKSTLLKILARITPPTRGEATIRGRVASLLEVGTGFHHELTGRENVLLSGAILGMTRKEIQRRMEQIIDFSGISDFIDTPVKRYSSGMYVRLGFSVAAHLDADVLLVDEVLAVGDAEFRRRCLGRIGDITRSGRTVVMVSHDMTTISQLCDWALWLQDGELADSGEPRSVIDSYMERHVTSCHRAEMTRQGEEHFWYQLLEVTTFDGRPADRISCDEPFRITGVIEIASITSDLYGTVYLTKTDGTVALFSDWRDVDPDFTATLKPGRYVFAIDVPARLLAPGEYTITADLATTSEGRVVHNPDVVSLHLSDYVSIRGDRRPGSIGTLLPWQLRPESTK